MLRETASLLCITLAACSSVGTPPPNNALAPRVASTARLIDPRSPTESEEGPYYRVELRGARVDTIAGLLTTDEPNVVGDSTIVGTLADTSAERIGFFRYRIDTRVLETMPMPAQFVNSLSDIAISPDGTQFTWAAFDGNNHGRAEVHRFPSGEVVRAAAEIAVESTDGRVGIGRWTAQGEPEIAIFAGTTPARPWVRFRFDRRSSRWLVDTLANSWPTHTD